MHINVFANATPEDSKEFFACLKKIPIKIGRLNGAYMRLMVKDEEFRQKVIEESFNEI